MPGYEALARPLLDFSRLSTKISSNWIRHKEGLLGYLEQRPYLTEENFQKAQMRTYSTYRYADEHTKTTYR